MEDIREQQAEILVKDTRNISGPPLPSLTTSKPQVSQHHTGQFLYSGKRTIRVIRVNDPLLNRNLGKYQLTHIWDIVLQDMLTLHLQ